MPLLSVYMLEPRDVLMNCSGWYDTLSFIFTSSGNNNQLPALMWLNLHVDISLGLPAVTLAKLNPDILNTTNILNVPTLTGSTYYDIWTSRVALDKIITHHYSPGVCRFALTLLSSSVATANVTDYDMIFFGRDIDIVCIMHGVYQSATTTTTSTYYDPTNRYVY